MKHYFPIPGRTLPSAFVPSRTNRNPPVLYYGIPVSVNNLPVYALRTHEAKNDDPPIHMVLKGLAALRRACKRRVFTAFPKVTYDEDHNLMLGLYSNYDMDEKREDEETETALFDRVKEEFKLDKNLPAMWFFSLESEWDPARDQKDWDDILEFSARNPYSSDDEDEWEGPDPYTRFVYSDEEDSGEVCASDSGYRILSGAILTSLSIGRHI